jgi:RNA polymerase-binding transcription factor
MRDLAGEQGMKKTETPTLTYEGWRELLLAERAELLVELGAKPAPLMEAAGKGEDDQAAALHEQFVTLSLKSMDYRKLKEIDAAMNRLETGEYGVCVACGKAISVKRLAAIPWASYCIGCQENTSSRKPPEERGKRAA